MISARARLTPRSRSEFDRFWEKQDSIRSLIILDNFVELQSPPQFKDYGKALKWGYPTSVGCRPLDLFQTHYLMHLTGLDVATVSFYLALYSSSLLPPRGHRFLVTLVRYDDAWGQCVALNLRCFFKNKNRTDPLVLVAVVTTGTGSGKTECFLLPILGKFAREAQTHGSEFGATPAVRAMVLYPMNALVNDQLGRLRLLFGDPRIVAKFMGWAGRPARFARYTSRTLYPGVRDEGKDKDRLVPIGKYYVRNLELAGGPASPQQAAAEALVRELKKRGKWPAKPDLVGWYGKKGGAMERRKERCVQEMRHTPR